MCEIKSTLKIVVCILLIIFPYYGSAKENFSPVLNAGKKWRIGYIQGGDYYEFSGQLKGTVESLGKIGWINPVNIPKEATGKQLWSWISKNIESNYIEFVYDAFWDNEWINSKREENKKNIYETAVKESYVDLMIVMGTAAGNDISDLYKNKGYQINTMVMCANDPVKSEIVKGYTWSGVDHIHAAIEKDKFLNEIDLFHRIVKFKTLGIVYQDTPEKKIYAALDDIKNAARKYNIIIVERKMSENYNKKQYEDEMIKFYENLAEQVDAVYVNLYMDETKSEVAFLKQLINPMIRHKVATWSQTPKTWMVKYGVLMGLNGADPADIGMFEAKVMAQILNKSKKPGEISQLFVNPKNEAITLNLETAQKIQLDLSWEALATADKIYEKICKHINDDVCEKEE